MSWEQQWPCYLRIMCHPTAQGRVKLQSCRLLALPHGQRLALGIPMGAARGGTFFQALGMVRRALWHRAKKGLAARLKPWAHPKGYQPNSWNKIIHAVVFLLAWLTLHNKAVAFCQTTKCTNYRTTWSFGGWLWLSDMWQPGGRKPLWQKYSPLWRAVSETCCIPFSELFLPFLSQFNSLC